MFVECIVYKVELLYRTFLHKTTQFFTKVIMPNNRYYRSPSLNAQWDDLSQSIGALLIEPERTSSKAETTTIAASRPNEISTRHWIDSTIRTHCIDNNCGKKFTLTERKHHCRK